jgi:hypothetical protein
LTHHLKQHSHHHYHPHIIQSKILIIIIHTS